MTKTVSGFILPPNPEPEDLPSSIICGHDLVQRMPEAEQTEFQAFIRDVIRTTIGADLRRAERDLEKSKPFIKELSDALLKVRPLGGSELFVQRFGEFYADPLYCGRRIEEMSASLDKEIRARIRSEKALAVSRPRSETP